MSVDLSTKPRRENIHFRITSEVKDLIDKAVVASGQSLTEFATRSLISSANEILEKEFATTLSNRDRDLLLKLLDEDDEPDQGLREAAEMHRKMVIKQ